MYPKIKLSENNVNEINRIIESGSKVHAEWKSQSGCQLKLYSDCKNWQLARRAAKYTSH
jgi:hypothetical protein